VIARVRGERVRGERAQPHDAVVIVAVPLRQRLAYFFLVRSALGCTGTCMHNTTPSPGLVNLRLSRMFSK
jgi:hypothetical protein